MLPTCIWRCSFCFSLLRECHTSCCNANEKQQQCRQMIRLLPQTSAINQNVYPHTKCVYTYNCIYIYVCISIYVCKNVFPRLLVKALYNVFANLVLLLLHIFEICVIWHALSAPTLTQITNRW